MPISTSTTCSQHHFCLLPWCLMATCMAWLMPMQGLCWCEDEPKWKGVQINYNLAPFSDPVYSRKRELVIFLGSGIRKSCLRSLHKALNPKSRRETHTLSIPQALHPSMGSSQNEGPMLVPLNIRCHNLTYNPRGPIILRRTPRRPCRICRHQTRRAKQEDLGWKRKWKLL